MNHLANLDAIVADAMRVWRPPPKLTVSQWADENYYLSPESAATPGRWQTLPYQREPLDALGDPTIPSVVVIKSARVGYTQMLKATLGYHMHQAPAGCLVIQPTLDDARGFSKDDLQPMIRDCPVLTKIVHEDSDGDTSGNTMLAMRYRGGVVSLIGANSGTGLRRISRKVIAADEVDAYPVLVGEGDVIKLAQKRSEYYHDRKFIGGSTPLIAGHSRIAEMFEEGDARRYFVPCPHCGHMDFLVFRRKTGKLAQGHWMEFDPMFPEHAHFVCSGCDEAIEHKHKRDMVARGEWRPTKVGLPGHRSYHMWAALSFSPGATWADIASEFVEAKGNPQKLRVFVNTTLGEPWTELGEAPDWERVFGRREHYEIGTVPEGVTRITAGVDVQKDRFYYEVVGWGEGKQSWSIEHGTIPGDTSNLATWLPLDEMLSRTWATATGVRFGLRMLAVDSGYIPSVVYSWARRHVGRVIAVKGVVGGSTILGSPGPVEVKLNGKRVSRGCKVWPVSGDIAKSELYGWLRMPLPGEGEAFPFGWCHFPQYDQSYFKQLTAEHLVSVDTRKGYPVQEWRLIVGRENHYLDCRVYARAAAALIGIDRASSRSRPPAPASVEPTPRARAHQEVAQMEPSRSDSRTTRTPQKQKSSWLTGGSRGGWLGKRR